MSTPYIRDGRVYKQVQFYGTTETMEIELRKSVIYAPDGTFTISSYEVLSPTTYRVNGQVKIAQELSK